MSGDESIPAEDLVALVRRLRKPHGWPAGAGEMFRNYTAGVNQGRELAAESIERLLGEYGVTVEALGAEEGAEEKGDDDAP